MQSRGGEIETIYSYLSADEAYFLTMRSTAAKKLTRQKHQEAVRRNEGRCSMMSFVKPETIPFQEYVSLLQQQFSHHPLRPVLSGIYLKLYQCIPLC